MTCSFGSMYSLVTLMMYGMRWGPYFEALVSLLRQDAKVGFRNCLALVS